MSPAPGRRPAITPECQQSAAVTAAHPLALENARSSRSAGHSAMAGVTYDLQWKESMVELLDLLEVMDPTAGDELQKQTDALDKDEKFQHFATLYIRYLQIFRKVEESYDMIVHPQQRMDIRKALEAVMGRLLEVRCLLIELNKMGKTVLMGKMGWMQTSHVLLS